MTGGNLHEPCVALFLTDSGSLGFVATCQHLIWVLAAVHLGAQHCYCDGCLSSQPVLEVRRATAC